MEIKRVGSRPSGEGPAEYLSLHLVFGWIRSYRRGVRPGRSYRFEVFSDSSASYGDPSRWLRTRVGAAVGSRRSPNSH